LIINKEELNLIIAFPNLTLKLFNHMILI